MTLSSKESPAQLALSSSSSFPSLAASRHATLTTRAVDRDLPITSLGLDSLLAVELSIRLARDLQVEVSSVRLLSGPTINLLAQQLAPLVGASNTTADAEHAARPREAALQP